ncbi:MAG: hypothetical protein IT162_19190 [Bryobacterales bacterium]|nr:hypothetical protein [Bryobacterales bacterium]
MASTTVTPCQQSLAADSPLSAFYSLNYHFGMLLGVADFETEQAYHRGKLRLHNAWLHRAGVAWGLGVTADLPRQEIRVGPGLAVDGAGRELFVEREACLSVPAWFEAHRNDPGFVFAEDAASIVFDAHVVIRFKACLTRQVPSLSEPCDQANTATAYSRVFETVEILLLPGLSAAAAPPYHRLRLLLGLDSPRSDDAGAVATADAEVLAAPRTIESFRLFAALDEIDLTPAAPGAEDSVILADLAGVTLDKTSGALRLTAAPVDVAVRPVHVATSTTQELLSGGSLGAGAAAPFAIPGSFLLDEAATRIDLAVTADLAPASVHPGAFSLSTFDAAAGWAAPAITAATYDNAARKVSLTFAGPLTGTLVRLIAHGAGPTPILGAATLTPLGHGHDYVHMHRRS